MENLFALVYFPAGNGLPFFTLVNHGGVFAAQRHLARAASRSVYGFLYSLFYSQYFGVLVIGRGLSALFVDVLPFVVRDFSTAAPR